MQSHRLARLLRIIVEVRTQPHKSPQQIAKDLGISIRQFYYDKDQLTQMGLRFSRAKGRFEILSDPAVTIEKLPLSEILALVLATRHLFATRDFSVVRRALKGLYTIVDHIPQPEQRLLKSLIEDVIIKNGFRCSPDILEDVARAVDEKRRVLVHFRHGLGKRRVLLDPLRFTLTQSKLFLDAYAVERKKRRRYRVESIVKIVFTPFFTPEHANVDGGD